MTARPSPRAARPVSRCVLGFAGLAALAASAGLLPLAPVPGASVAWAQAMQDTEAYVAVVTSNRVPMRSGDMRQFYQVAELTEGQMVLVVGESADWVRVRYPTGLRAYLSQEEGVVDGDNLVLIRPSRLRAVNAANPDPTASWKPLLAEPLPVNTSLTLVGRIPSRTNREFFLVEAPAQSVGYVTRSAIRRATEAEASAFHAQRIVETGRSARQPEPQTSRPAERAAPQPTQVEPAPAQAESPRVETPRESRPAESRPAEPRSTAPVRTTDDLIEPMAEPAPARPQIQTPAQTPAPAPAATEPAPARPITGDLPEPEVIRQDPAGQGADARPSRGPARDATISIEDLESAFQDVLAQPVLESEVDELLTEFQRVRGQIEDSPLTARLRAQLDRRISMLELRRDLRTRLRESEASAIDIELAQERLDRRIAELAQSDVYVAVGRLQPSTVYDGQRLPLLYRVRSVGDGPGRTLGYIAPTEGLDLAAKLGRIVGIVGYSERDADRNLLMLRARRVNEIDLSQLGIDED